jgi:hypothetical protein
MTALLKLEFDLANNNNVLFPPLGTHIRGRWELARVKEPSALEHKERLGDSFPSQRLVLNLDKSELAVIEPLHEEKHRVEKQRIEQRLKLQLPVPGPPVKVHMPTCLFWARRLVEDGMARVVEGSMPADNGGKPRLKVFGQEAPDMSPEIVALKASLERQQQQIDQLLALLTEQRGSNGGGSGRSK